MISTTLFVALFVFSGTASSWIFNFSRFANGGEMGVYTGHFVLFRSRIIHSVDSEPIRMLEIPRSLSERE